MWIVEKYQRFLISYWIKKLFCLNCRKPRIFTYALWYRREFLVIDYPACAMTLLTATTILSISPSVKV